MKDTRATRRGPAASWRSSGTQEVVSAEEVMSVDVPEPEMDQMMLQEDADADQSMEEPESGAPEIKKKPWERGGAKIKKKKNPTAKNQRIRKHVQPKNAVMCLNELQPGLTYVTEMGRGVSMPICVSVEVSEQRYKGYGSSKSLAKQAAAEAALISFVKPPAQPTDEDETPWATLASFAIYKLFNEWREGRIGMNTSSPMGLQGSSATVQSTGMNFPHFTAPAPPAPQATELKPEVPKNKTSTEPSMVKPAKSLPDNAAGIHPAVVLHQMRPNVQYNIEISTRENQRYFIASAVIDGNQFTGEGPKIKKAKFHLAKEAIKVLFSVESTFEMAS